MKYVVCQVQKDGKPFLNIPVVFPDLLVHAMVFAQMRALLEMQYFEHTRKTEIIALSAGELSSTTFGEDVCGGESTSLGVKSRELEDSNLLCMNDYGSASMV